MRISSQHRRPRPRGRPLLATICCLALTSYLAHHAVNGRYGLESRRTEQARAARLAKVLGRLKARRAGLDRDIALLAQPPHPDIVEEAARRTLGYAYPAARVLVLAP